MGLMFVQQQIPAVSNPDAQAILNRVVTNIVESPDEQKYRAINTGVCKSHCAEMVPNLG